MLVTEMRIKFCYIFMNETINCGQNNLLMKMIKVYLLQNTMNSNVRKNEVPSSDIFGNNCS